MRNRAMRRRNRSSHAVSPVIRMLSILSAAALCVTALPAEYLYAEEAEQTAADLGTAEEWFTDPESDGQDIEGNAEQEKEVIRVESAEVLLAVAAKCDVDSWSENKQIELQADIALDGMGFEGFPVFAGTFNGNGHTISGFHIKGDGYADGFFRYITATGIVQNLKLSGTVESENDEKCTGGLCGINAGWILDCTYVGSVEGKSETGGIVGENESVGTISSCYSYGTVTGYDRAGGITGANYGAVRNCTNKAGINSDSSWLEEEDEAGLEWLLEDVSERKLVSGTDIGGIAGYSRGIIINCSNTGVVGYEHNGYNIGGIVGRQSGQVLFCNNSGRIYGRKDVGGIVGQMEPYISVEEAESISEAVQRLHDLVDKFLDDAGDTQDAVSEDFDRLREHSDNALDEADLIADKTVDFVDENVSAVNEVANRLDYCLDQIPGIMDEVKFAVEDMDEAVDSLGKMADALDISGDISDNPYDETAHARLSLVSGVGGDVSADQFVPAEGEVVTINVIPEEGYKVDAVRVEDASKKTVELTDVTDTSAGGDFYSYSFVMPKDNVVVKASFKYDSQSASSKTADGDIGLAVTNPSANGTDGHGVSTNSYTGSSSVSNTNSAADSIGSDAGNSSDSVTDAVINDKIVDADDDSEKDVDDDNNENVNKDGTVGDSSKPGNDEETDTSEIEGSKSSTDRSDTISSSLDSDSDAGFQLYVEDGIDAGNAAGTPVPVQNQTYTITVSKNGAFERSEDDVQEGAVVVVRVTPKDGCQAKVEITADGTPVPYKEKLDGRAYQFTMPGKDVTVNVDFSNAGLIVESNAGGKADYTISNYKVTLTVKPDTGYALDGNPSVAYENGEQISVSRKSSGSNVYTFQIAPDKGTVRVRLNFKVSSESAAVSSSRNNLSQNVSLLQEQMQKVSDSMKKIEQIQNNGGDQDALIEAMLELAGNLSDAGETLSYVMSDLNSIANIMTPYMVEALKEAGVEMDSVIDSMEDVYTHMDTAFGMIRSTMIYMNGKFDIQFAKLGDDVDRSVDSLFEQLGIISDYAGQIGDDLDVHSDILEADMHAINDQMNHIFQLFSEKIDDVEDLYFDESGYEDISEEDIDASTDGKVERAVNKGVVQGDVNAGGIAGSMAIDEEDPEGNAAGSVDRSFGSRYLTKCVINRCENSGQVKSKKNGAGGIVGYMNLGIVANSEAYGSAESTEGEYIGGICGESHALIQNCYSLISLDGSQYVGGIAGSGTKIKDCYAMVLIGEDAVHKGAVAGWIATEEDERIDYQEDISGNYFVSSSLNGIDCVSYAGIAQPVTYEQLLETVGLPVEFRHLKITFVADDRVVDQIEVKYGKPLSQVTFPEAPEVAGSYGKWPDVSDQVMEANLTLEAEYNDTITTLPSKETVLATEAGQPKKPYAYVDGFYTDEAELNVDVSEWTAAQTKEEGLKPAVVSTVYTVRLGNAGIAPDEVLKLRLYRPYEEIKAIYVKTEAGDWQEISYQEYGQYIQVEMQGEKAEYCILSGENNYVWVICVAAGVVVLFLLLLIREKKLRNK